VFALRLMGGGDVKLIAVLALWVGWAALADFAVLVALLGGVFSLLVYVARKLRLYLPWRQRIRTPRLFQEGAPIPYGVAIAGAFLWMMWQGKVVLLTAAI